MVVPPGMVLGRVLELASPSRRGRENSRTRAIDWFVARMQPVAAVTAVIALLLPPRPGAGLLACPWLLPGLLIAISGVAGSISALASRRVPLLREWALLRAKIDLLEGGFWF